MHDTALLVDSCHNNKKYCKSCKRCYDNYQSLSVLVEAKGEPTPNLNLKFAISTGARFQIDQYFQMNDVITNRTMCTSSDPRVKVAYKFDKSDEEIKSFHITTNGELTMAENARQLSCQNSSCDYQLNITCWAYLHNENELLAQADITITVVYRLVNKFRPEFADSTLNITLPENLKHENHPIITTLNAIDQDSDECDDIRYSITSGNGGGYFQLDPHTGTLTLVSPLNFERDSQFSLTVQAANALCSPQLSSTMTVYIRVLKVDSATETVNDLLPVGTLIASSTPGSNALIFLNTSNADQLSNEGQFQFSFAVMDDFVTEYFELNIDTGDLTLIKSLKYKYCLKPTFSNQIVISIRLCGAGESECSIFDINLTVSISSDCSTSFDQNKYTIPVNESTPVGLKLYNITCRSPGNLEANTNRKYSVVHGHSVFNLSGNTLVLNTPLDYESETEFISVIECRDLILERENTATATIIIKVLPSNEYNPKLTQPFYTYTLSSFEGVQFPLVIGHIQAHDNDSGAGGELVYRLDNSADSRFLQIGANGTLSLIGSLDSRTCDKLVVVVEVSDGLFTDRATVLINTPVIGQTKSSNCDVFCIAFIASTILLVLSLVIHIVTFIAIVIYYKKKQRERVVKFQESILEISKRNSQRRSTSENASHFR